MKAAVGLALGLTLATGPALPGAQEPSRNPTPVFTCGADEELQVPIPARWGTVVLAGDGRLYRPCQDGDHPLRHREVRESALLTAVVSVVNVARPAARARDPELAWRGAQAHARLRNPVGALTPPTAAPVLAGCSARVNVQGTGVAAVRWQPGLLFVLMRHADPLVRREAAYGLGMKLAETGAELIPFAMEELRACLERETEAGIDGLILEAFGVTRYGTDEQRAEAEALLVAESRAAEYPRVLGATKGLEALIRLAPRRPISDATRERLRELAGFGARAAAGADIQDRDARVRRLAMMALQSSRDTDVATLRRATADGDWQVRRLAAMRLNLADPAQAALAEAFRAEEAFQVRYELVGAIGRLVSTTKTCAPLVERIKDPAPLVAMRAMDLLPADCSDLDAALPTLVEWADKLERPEGAGTWHLPSRALTALARVKPEEARARLDGAVRHQVWQVRAAAAAICPLLEAGDAAARLARDDEPNVRTAALDALARTKHADLVPAAVDALNNAHDHQLLRTAALVLRNAPAETRDRVTTALLGALDRLTREESDTSRDPRVAILDRLGELMAPARSTDLEPYLLDWDDEVIAAAKKAFQSVVGAPPGESTALRRRYPLQPTEAELGAMPRQAILLLDDGQVTIELLPEVAPVTIARFVDLVRRGAYDGRTFHRIVPNFVVQGGSPGANEYSGVTSRYLRDEVGPQASHLRGAVGISTRGRDTGDAQLFIDLVDLPRLDRDYTVFGYVRSGMELVDRMLEGARVKAIQLK